MKFFVTFGAYHPLADGWIELEADGYNDARRCAFQLFGPRFGSVYGVDDFRPEFFLSGKIGKTIRTTDVPGGPL